MCITQPANAHVPVDLLGHLGAVGLVQRHRVALYRVEGRVQLAREDGEGVAVDACFLVG